MTALPTPPSTKDYANFNERADEFLGALPTMVSEINTALLTIKDNVNTTTNMITTSKDEVKTELEKASDFMTTSKSEIKTTVDKIIDIKTITDMAFNKVNDLLTQANTDVVPKCEEILKLYDDIKNIKDSITNLAKGVINDDVKSDLTTYSSNKLEEKFRTTNGGGVSLASVIMLKGVI